MSPFIDIFFYLYYLNCLSIFKIWVFTNWLNWCRVTLCYCFFFIYPSPRWLAFTDVFLPRKYVSQLEITQLYFISMLSCSCFVKFCFMISRYGRDCFDMPVLNTDNALNIYNFCCLNFILYLVICTHPSYYFVNHSLLRLTKTTLLIQLKFILEINSEKILKYLYV